jgi:pectinesterase
LLFLPNLLGCGNATETTETYDPALSGDFGRLDLYRQPTVSGLRPGVLLVHPGGWSSGSKADLSPQATFLAQQGFIVANTNYRLVPQVSFPVPLQDVWCALACWRPRATRRWWR